MALPTVVSYSDTSTTISWTALTAPSNGNSDVTAYDLQWKVGSGSFTDLTSLSATTFTTTLTAGTSYQF